MSILGNLSPRLEDIGRNFTVEAFGPDTQPMIDEVLRKHGKEPKRKHLLDANMTVWTVLGLCLRREISYKNVLSWLLSGRRSRGLECPRNPVSDGAITHARKRLGVGVFRDFFFATTAKVRERVPDFFGYFSLGVDGTTMTMPDTPANSERFGRPGTGRSKAAFPQVRIVAMVATAVHLVYALAFAPYCGKGTGEPTLAMQLVLENACQGILFLLDKGFYGAGLLHGILERNAAFIVAVPDGVKLKPIPRTKRPDGSYLAWLFGKVEDSAGPLPNGRKRWKEVRDKVRVIEYQVPGFRKRRIATSLLELDIPAREIVRHYHRRWEIELAYDELKTHQCARRRGQCQTVLRSKLPALVEQEIYGLVIAYNLLRSRFNEAAQKHDIDPLSVSFVDGLQAILEAIPLMSAARAQRLQDLYDQLIDDIAACRMKHWRRPRAYPRVVKVKMSNFQRKKPQNVGGHRDFDAQMQIFGEVA